MSYEAWGEPDGRPLPKQAETLACMGAAYLRECFAADFDAGTLVWLVRPLDHFTTARACAAWNGRNAGKTAGGAHKEGYRVVSLAFNGKHHRLLSHRVLWCMRTGEWPTQTIDHRNCNRTSNGAGNLREASYADQNANRPAIRNGLKGVTFDKRTGRYLAQITRGGRNHFLGRFATEIEGNAAYLLAAKALHGEFAKA